MRFLKKIDIWTPNETEADFNGSPRRGERAPGPRRPPLKKKGVGTVIITRGPRGAFVSGPGVEGPAPGFKVRAVDTTAAGDVFNGALAVALTEGRALMEAVRFANAAAAISVTRWGAQPSAPKRPEIESLLSRA